MVFYLVKGSNPGYYLSAKAGVNFKSSISLAFEFLASQMQQSYDITAGNLQYHKNLKMQSLEKIILLRGCGTKGGYLEAGLRLISFLNVSETNSTNVSQTIIRDDFNNNCFGILGGFGGPIYFHKKYDFNFGIRVSYTIASILKDGIYPIHDDIYHIPYSSDATTNPLIVYLTLGFDWHFQWATETPKF
ncbi:MAG: hypothetical protein HY738_03620 [Bacteroidia bacterium]|nr:hypothetical protein [Bacteroidia bacterium]